MAAAQGRQAVGAVVPGILAVADTDQRRVQQGDDRGHDFVATESRCRQFGFKSLTQFRQGQPELTQAQVFVGVAHLPPARMITVLFATPGIPAGGLQVPAWIGADPHLGIGGWHRECVEAFDCLRVGDALASRVEIGEFSPQFPAGDARLGVIDIMQVRRQCIGHDRRPGRGITGRYSHGPRPAAVVPADLRQYCDRFDLCPELLARVDVQLIAGIARDPRQ
ncbi:hypothetical protein D3C85_868570 [compost metagenome]